MKGIGAGHVTGRALVAVALAVSMTGAVSVAAAPVDRPVAGTAGAAVPVVAPLVAEPAVVAVPVVGPIAAPAPAAPPPPAPADLVRETGSWFAHGYTLDLREDGTGEFAVWLGAFDGTRVQLRLIPAPGSATVAEITAVEQVGAGALAPHEVPGVGGLVTIDVGDPIRTAHVEWTSGANRLTADLCPTEGLNAQQMTELRCGA